MADLDLYTMAVDLVQLIRNADVPARLIVDPDKGPGAVVDLIDAEWDPRIVGCGDPSTAAYTATVFLLGYGRSRDQLRRIEDDTGKILAAVTRTGWRLTAVQHAESTPDNSVRTLTLEN